MQQIRDDEGRLNSMSATANAMANSFASLPALDTTTSGSNAAPVLVSDPWPQLGARPKLVSCTEPKNIDYDDLISTKNGINIERVTVFKYLEILKYEFMRR